MKLSALALDFDGTIAQNDVLDPHVREAIAELRAHGILVTLVTGRILDDLRRLTGSFHFVDAVVGENGAVLEFPASGYSTVTGQPPPESLLVALRDEGVVFRAGRAVVEADAGEAPRILAIIRRLELPLVLLFNRDRVMVLPQAISKATGLRHALNILRLSEHNLVGIGDAENDHQLLQACEVGVAVEWGSEALKAAADYVLPGEGPPAVARYLRGLAVRRRIPVPAQTRRRLLLGHTEDGRPLALGVRDRNELVTGDPQSGKSWVTALLAEQLILHGYCLCVIDPEGDYTSLDALPNVAVFGGADPLPRPRDLLRALRHPKASVVLDLSYVSQEEKADYLRSVLPGLAALRRQTGLPHRIVVDEAHFLHEPDVLELLDLELNGYTFVTYRASTLNPAILAATQAILVTRESDPHEVRALFTLCQSCAGRTTEAEWERLLDSLVLGEVVALPVTEEAEGEVRRIQLVPRVTTHVRHLAKYTDIPVPEGRAFLFSHDGLQPTRARTLREFVGAVERAPAAALDGHFRRRDFSRWVAEVLGDYPLARELRRIEDQYRAGTIGDSSVRLVQVVRSRYELADSPPISDA
jgi:hydroxymethylpyrimidine pyrophosphatase-like HAD family hydrolase